MLSSPSQLNELLARTREERELFERMEAGIELMEDIPDFVRCPAPKDYTQRHTASHIIVTASPSITQHLNGITQQQQQQQLVLRETAHARAQVGAFGMRAHHQARCGNDSCASSAPTCRIDLT
jgi:hypothetical protein